MESAWIRWCEASKRSCKQAGGSSMRIAWNPVTWQNETFFLAARDQDSHEKLTRICSVHRAACRWLFEVLAGHEVRRRRPNLEKFQPRVIRVRVGWKATRSVPCGIYRDRNVFFFAGLQVHIVGLVNYNHVPPPLIIFWLWTLVHSPWFDYRGCKIK